MKNPVDAATAIIALGSNLGDPAENVRQAVARLRGFSDHPLRESSLWETTPLDCPPGSPRFINAVVLLTLRSGETPESLLARLQALERDFGCQPKQILNEPRPLDLDLISFGSLTRSTPELTLPHSRAAQRQFVLQPLGELVPDFVLPGQTKSIAELLAGLPLDATMLRIFNG